MDESTINSLIKKAVNAVQTAYERDEIISLLKTADDDTKPLIIISLDTVLNEDEASLLIHNLTGCDGRIREACAHKISELLQNRETAEYFLNEASLKIILDGIMDINPNVSRALIEGIQGSKEMQKLLFFPLIERIEDIIEKLKKILNTNFIENKLNNRKNHAKNKIVFNLYWALEALSYTKFADRERLNDILNFTSFYIDYTIREKSAKILSKMEKPSPILLHKLKNDVNFYVKNQLLC